MRLAQIMLSKGFGGAERSYVDLAVALADAGHEVHAISHRAFAGRAALDAHPGVRHRTVNAFGRFDPFARRAIRRAIAEAAPAVVHAHLARASEAAGRVCPALGVPLIAKTHNYVDLKYYRHVDVFIPTTRDQARYLAAQGVVPERIERIPNFSSVDPIAAPIAGAEPRASGGGPLVFASYGRLVEKKGFDLLLEAFRAVIETGVGAHLVLGGDGPERARLTALVGRLDLGETVTMSGWVDDPAAFLADADVFVLPSRLEPFGIVVLEAMARAVPIVSTLSEGPREILDEETAYLAPVGEAEALAEAMKAAAKDAPGRAARAGRALRIYRERYHRDAVVPRIVALYERVAARSSAQR